MNHILVTGATGFVGRFLSVRLLSDGMNVRGTMLSSEAPDALTIGVEPTVIDPLGPDTNLATALQGIDTVIHLAARVHIMRETFADPLGEYRLTNTRGTTQLATQAAASGVKRLIFLSTIGVNGNNSGNKPYRDDDEPSPYNHYSISKFEAEQALWQISRETGMEVTVIRSPLAYGPRDPGNFLKLLKLLSKGIPLPFASVSNKRSLIYVGNLVDALIICASHPLAAGKTYLVSDGEDVSTPELIHRANQALGIPTRLFPFPPGLMRLAGTITCQDAAVNSLLGTLTVDSSRIRSELGLRPPYTMEEGLRDTAEWFKRQIMGKG